jgi:hypothetical protein
MLRSWLTAFQESCLRQRAVPSPPRMAIPGTGAGLLTVRSRVPGREPDVVLFPGLGRSASTVLTQTLIIHPAMLGQ